MFTCSEKQQSLCPCAALRIQVALGSPPPSLRCGPCAPPAAPASPVPPIRTAVLSVLSGELPPARSGLPPRCPSPSLASRLVETELKARPRRPSGTGPPLNVTPFVVAVLAPQGAGGGQVPQVLSLVGSLPPPPTSISEQRGKRRCARTRGSLACGVGVRRQGRQLSERVPLWISDDGVSCFPKPLCRSVSFGRNPLLLAVSSFQRAELGPPRRLLPGRLLHDVGHPPGPVPARRPAPLPGLGRNVRRGPSPGRHHVDLPRHRPPHQPVHFLPQLSVLQGRRPEELPEAVLLQPLASAPFPAADADLQEAGCAGRRGRAAELTATGAWGGAKIIQGDAQGFFFFPFAVRQGYFGNSKAPGEKSLC